MVYSAQISQCAATFCHLFFIPDQAIAEEVGIGDGGLVFGRDGTTFITFILCLKVSTIIAKFN